jgi:hypothetical protein
MPGDRHHTPGRDTAAPQTEAHATKTPASPDTDPFGARLPHPAHPPLRHCGPSTATTPRGRDTAAPQTEARAAKGSGTS